MCRKNALKPLKIQRFSSFLHFKKVEKNRHIWYTYLIKNKGKCQ